MNQYPRNSDNGTSNRVVGSGAVDDFTVELELGRIRVGCCRKCRVGGGKTGVVCPHYQGGWARFERSGLANGSLC